MCAIKEQRIDELLSQGDIQDLFKTLLIGECFTLRI